MTLAVAALFAKGPTRIRNVYNWRVKVTSISASHARVFPVSQIQLGLLGRRHTSKTIPLSMNGSVRHVMHCLNLMCCPTLFAAAVFATYALPG